MTRCGFRFVEEAAVRFAGPDYGRRRSPGAQVAGASVPRALEGAQRENVSFVEQQALIALPPRAFELTSLVDRLRRMDLHLPQSWRTLFRCRGGLSGNACTRAPPVMVLIFLNDVVATRAPTQQALHRLLHPHRRRYAFHMRTDHGCRHTAELVGPACASK